MTPRIAIIGTGAMAQRHATALREAGASLIAIAGVDRAQTTRFARHEGIETIYDAVDDLYCDSRIDAIVIASPSTVHAAQTVGALRAGHHVLTEIPVGMSLAEADAVSAAAFQAGKYVAVAHTLRYCEPYLRVRSLVESGELEIRHIVARTLMLRQDNTGLDGRPREWTDDALWHHGAHTVDAVLWLMGADSAVTTGRLGPVWTQSGKPMDIGVVLATSDGALATIALSYHSRFAARDFVIIGENRTLQIAGPRLVAENEVVVDCGSTAEMERAGLSRQDADFLRAVVEERKPGCTVEDVLPTMRVLEQLANKQEA